MIQLSSSKEKKHKHTASLPESNEEPKKEYEKMTSGPQLFSLKELLHSSPPLSKSCDDLFQLTSSSHSENGEVQFSSPANSLSIQTSPQQRHLRHSKSEETVTSISRDQIMVHTNKISNGSFAHVYTGTLITSKKEIAVKVFDITIPNIGKKLYERSEKFYDEWNTLKKIPSHQNIAQFIGVVKWESHLGLVFELVKNGDLTAYLEANAKTLKMNECIRILQGIATGLDILHSNNPSIIHRDLSSRNILLTENLDPKICDFGSAICVYESSLKPEKTRLYQSEDYYAWKTDEYIAPEIWEGTHPWSSKSDVYSVGVITMETAIAFTEKKYYLPFTYGTSFENRFEKIEYIRKCVSPILPSETDSTFITFIKECITTDVEKRITVKKLVHDLKNLGSK